MLPELHEVKVMQVNLQKVELDTVFACLLIGL
jgi:hypothetical protein